jgi:uncharacterized membrane protein (DUF4010 family)
MLLDELQPYAVSLAIGLGAGVERERSHADGDGALGVRTFALIALAGTVAGTVRDAALTGGVTAAVALLAVSSYWRQAAVRQNDQPKDLGLTTELAAVLVFGLGFLAAREAFVALILGIVTVTLLFSRDHLHAFVRHVLRPAEIAAVLTLAGFAFVVVPFLPGHALDPWGLVNPRRLAQVMTLIAGIEFGGYVVERFAGPRTGILVSGFFGGLASSTAVFVGLPKLVKERPATWTAALGAGLLATAATLLFFVVIVAAASPDLTLPVGVPAAVSAATAAILGWFIGRRGDRTAGEAASRRHPLDVRAVVKLGGFIGLLLIVATVVERTLGADALGLVSFVGGLFELHAVAFANATLHSAGSITTAEATPALLLPLAASFVSKLAMTWTLGGGRFAGAMTVLLLIVAGVGAAAATALRFLA